MQLVLNDVSLDTPTQSQSTWSTQQLCDEIMPELEARFAAILQYIQLIPFMPLEYGALEKIVRLKIKTLAKQLDLKFGIKLDFAPEVVKFLAHEIFWHKSQNKSLNQMLEQHLYGAVAHEILSHAENKNHFKHLLLQLNDSGQMLKCEFITATEANLFNL